MIPVNYHNFWQSNKIEILVLWQQKCVVHNTKHYRAWSVIEWLCCPICNLVNFFKNFNFTRFSDQRSLCVDIIELQLSGQANFAMFNLFTATTSRIYKICHRDTVCGVHGWRATTNHGMRLQATWPSKRENGWEGGDWGWGIIYNFQEKQGLKYCDLPLH